MILEHAFTVPTGPDETWRTLLDVERVAPCMPGASLDSVEGDDFTGRIRVKLGAIQMAYKMKGRFAEKDESARRVVIEGSGKESRGGGTVKSTITLQLLPAGESTEVKVLTDLAITGKPAQFGRGALDDIGARILGQFADNLAAMVSEDPSQEQAATISAAPTEPGSPDAAGVVAPARTERPAAVEAEPLDLMGVIAPSPDRIIAVVSSVTALVLALILLGRSRAHG
ncbi:SRPBCC family protein [Janibacter terrae]|uniref:SRPBCC family protein n=1 Tax=Janibacter terrae TaxID=103817 RepID=UPI000832F4A0|nr:SRPBCC family protein [Janibacter terrae]